MGVVNTFVKLKATKEQEHDLQNFSSIGQAEFLLRTAFFILGQPSNKLPTHSQKGK